MLDLRRREHIELKETPGKETKGETAALALTPWKSHKELFKGLNWVNMSLVLTLTHTNIQVSIYTHSRDKEILHVLSCEPPHPPPRPPLRPACVCICLPKLQCHGPLYWITVHCRKVGVLEIPLPPPQTLRHDTPFAADSPKKKKKERKNAGGVARPQ